MLARLRAPISRSVAASVSKLQDYAAELDEIGVEIRDFTRGVVDFSAIQDGREVKLCWRFGEPQIRHWHEVGAGVGDRVSWNGRRGRAGQFRRHWPSRRLPQAHSSTRARILPISRALEAGETRGTL